ncbi:MAG: hypothetical protein EA345_10295 [Halomonas sp.]|nr:MAG: hypothetical protein EA345_10295 [Halomonas sp.]
MILAEWFSQKNNRVDDDGAGDAYLSTQPSIILSSTIRFTYCSFKRGLFQCHYITTQGLNR